MNSRGPLRELRGRAWAIGGGGLAAAGRAAGHRADAAAHAGRGRGLAARAGDVARGHQRFRRQPPCAAGLERRRRPAADRQPRPRASRPRWRCSKRAWPSSRPTTRSSSWPTAPVPRWCASSWSLKRWHWPAPVNAPPRWWWRARARGVSSSCARKTRPGVSIARAKCSVSCLDGNERPQVKVVVTQADIDTVGVPGGGVQMRLAHDPSRVIDGRIVRQQPAGKNELPSRVLAVSGGGRIAIDPRDSQGVRDARALVPDRYRAAGWRGDGTAVRPARACALRASAAAAGGAVVPQPAPAVAHAFRCLTWLRST